MAWWWQRLGDSNAAGDDIMSEVLVGTVGGLPLLFAGTSRYVAAVLAMSTATAVVVAELKRRGFSAEANRQPTESEYTKNFNKAVAIAATTVLSVTCALLLVFDPGATEVAVWTGFAALIGAGSVLPGTYAELVELDSRGVYRLYWLPLVFAAALFATLVAFVAS